MALRENHLSQTIAQVTQDVARDSNKIATSSNDIATQTKIVAEDTNKIALAGKKDNAILTSIAILTIIFLPATFVSVSLA